MSSRPGPLVDRLWSAGRLPLAAAATVLLFLFAVQLLGAATQGAAPLLRRFLLRVVAGDVAALGLGWVGAYVLANGSVVAALALSLFTADLLTVPQLFLLVVGSRLGAAGIVVFIGAADYVQRRRYALAESVSMGLLTFLLTLSVYLPVAAVGFLGLPLLGAGRLGGRFVPVGALRVLGFFEPLARDVTTGVGPAPTFVLALALLLGSLKLFDRVLAEVDTRTLRRQFFDHFRRTWLSFGLGLVVTGLTTSVAFSLGVIVPLYNRNYVTRDELIPYVLGANIGTLLDTLVVAAVLASPAGLAVVAYVVGLAGVVTLVALTAGDRYTSVVSALDDRLLEDRAAFVAFVAALVVVPLGLLLLPPLVG